MDVHPPHEPIRSWKDFLLHLLTITIGLLIALALEAAVESLHYRHLVKDARENLRREIKENREVYAENMKNLEADREHLVQNIEQLREIRAGRPPEHIDMHWKFGWSSFGDSAWKSSGDVGAIPHMQPETIEAYANTYRQQELVNDQGRGILLDQARAAAPLMFAKDSDPRGLLPTDIQTLMLATADLTARINTLANLMKPLEADYAELLAQD